MATHFYGVTNLWHQHGTLASLLLLDSERKKKIGFVNDDEIPNQVRDDILRLGNCNWKIRI